MSIDLCVCGVSCAECNYRLVGECADCQASQGKVWWVKYVGAKICPIYECVTVKMKLDDCGSCPDLPCERWHSLKDPNYTDEEHAAGIAERTARLTELHRKK